MVIWLCVENIVRLDIRSVSSSLVFLATTAMKMGEEPLPWQLFELCVFVCVCVFQSLTAHQRGWLNGMDTGVIKTDTSSHKSVVK